MRVVKFFAPLLSAAFFAAEAAPAPVAARVLWPSSETEVRTLRDSRLSVPVGERRSSRQRCSPSGLQKR